MASSSKKHDVFLSFRGADTRDGFTSHLRHGLERKQIGVFMDDALERGEAIQASLMEKIEESSVSVVIFSEKYATSTWCLDELVKIHECTKLRKQKVIPVFYGVDPTDVQELRGNYAVTNPLYREALVAISNLSGFHSENPLFKPESKLIDEITEEVSRLLNELHPSLPCNYGLFGIDSPIKDVERLLCVESTSDVMMVGIWGMGGIGKTALADAVYDQVKGNFHSSCFVSESYRNGVKDLQDKIIRELLDENIKVDSSHTRTAFYKTRLRKIRALIVLDDVRSSLELKSLLEDDLHLLGSLGPGSRIIVTTRDQHVVETANVDSYVYEVKPLDHDQARELFCWHAFHQQTPPEEFKWLTEEAIPKAGGVPLALVVLGSALKLRNVEYWKDLLRKLESIPHNDITSVLRLSYDGLDPEEREMFLDIGCFFRGCVREEVQRIMEAYGLHPRVGIQRLIDKSLVTDTYGRLIMHDLIRDMALGIAGEEQRNKRLWNRDDITKALRNVEGTDNVRGIVLEEEEFDDCDHMETSPDAFIKMSKLRLLDIRCKVQLPRGLEFLPNSTRYLRWDYFPLQYLPINFHLDELVELDLSRSKLKQLVLVKTNKNLKRIILRFCCDLISISDLANAPNLEVIDVTGCSKLVELGPSIGNLSKLTGLHLRWCSSLKTISGLPSSIKDLDLTFTGISQLPWTIGHLAHIKHLSLESCSSLLSLPESLCRMENLGHLDLKHCSNLASLPNTFSNLKNLWKLDLSHCNNLSNLPEHFGKLKSLVELDMSGSGIKALPSSIELLHLECIHLNHCLLLDFPQQVCSIKSLQVLNIKGNNFTRITAKIRDLSNLRRLDLSNCEYLLSLPDLPPSLELLFARNCKSLESVPVPFTFPQVFMDLSNCLKLDHMAPALMEQYLLEMDVSAFEVPELSFTGNEVPKWMKYRNNNGSSLPLELESSRHSINVVFCVVVAPKASDSRFSNNRAQLQALLSDDNGNISCYNAFGIVEVSESQSGLNVILWNGKIQCGKRVTKASFVCKWLGDDENGHVSRCERNDAIIKCGIHPVIEGEDQGSRRLHLLSRL